jgi:uncharacterized protein YigA (DUF484 family)
VAPVSAFDPADAERFQAGMGVDFLGAVGQMAGPSPAFGLS